MTSKELEEILKSPITKGAKGRFISIEQLEQIKTDLEAWYEIKDLYKKGYFSRIALPMESHEKIKKALEVEDGD